MAWGLEAVSGKGTDTSGPFFVVLDRKWWVRQYSWVCTGGDMKKRALFLILVSLFLCGRAGAWETYVGKTMTVEMVNVPAGNVLTVKGNNGKELTINFYGVGIPTMKQPFGQEAHQLLSSILPKGRTVTLTTVNEGDDGVISALVQVNDRSVNNQLISEGLGWVHRRTCKAFFCRRWHIEEHIAQTERRGIWSLNMSTPPWQWGEPKN